MYELVFTFSPSPDLTEAESDTAARKWKRDLMDMLSRSGVVDVRADLYRLKVERTAVLSIV